MKVSSISNLLEMLRKKHLPSMLTLALASFLALSAAPAMAQFAAPQPPPIGSGDTPQPVTPGDQGGQPQVPSGQADMTSGTNFPVGTGSDRTVVRLYKQDTNGRGQRMVQTLRPDTLTPDAKSKIQGILGNLGNGEQSIDITVTDQQLEQVNDALAQYPAYQMNGNRKQITQDAAAPLPGRETSLYAFPGVIPTVATFGRYLVILGVVAATIFMALAAYSMVNGGQYGAARVLGAASGLFMLLAAYTIWKIVQMNTFNANSDRAAQIKAKADAAPVGNAFMQYPQLPATPAINQTSTGRSGVPVQPLYNSGN